MDAVKEFNAELCSLYEIQPPVSKPKMSQITKTAIKALKFYKHVVQSVEKFIQKCRQEYKVPGLYIIDSIIRCSRKQFGPDKDMFAPRFSKNIVITFHNLFDCPHEDISKMIRVLNLWQKNGVYHPGIIQPLLDLASDPHNPAVFETVQKQVEQVTGLTPSMPLKCDQKPPALTADALQLGTGLDLKSDLQGDFSKVINQLMQSMIPNPMPALNPQVQLQLFQQLLQLPAPMVPSAPLLQNNPRLPSSTSSSAIDSSLIGQIQLLTQQLLNQTAPTPANQQSGLNSSQESLQKQPKEPPEMERFDDRVQTGEMSSLDKRIMFMCEGREDTDSSCRRSEHDRSRKPSQSKRTSQSNFIEVPRNTPEPGYASDVANPSGSPNTPDHGSSMRSTPRRSSIYNDQNDDDDDDILHGNGCRRTPSSGTNVNNRDELRNGSGMEYDSESRYSDRDSRVEPRSASSRRNRKRRGSREESRSKRQRRYEEEDGHSSRRSRHDSRSGERLSTKWYPRADPQAGRSERSRHKKRLKHDQDERRRSRDGSRSRDKHSSRIESTSDRTIKPGYNVEYEIDEDDDDDVIFVDIQKKTVDVSRFLEKKLPTFKPLRNRTSRSSSRGSSVEFISQDLNTNKPVKQLELTPPIKTNMISICTTTLWIGHLSKSVTEDEIKNVITNFGEVVINLVPPRGCAFITFSTRSEAYKALDHLKNISIQGNQLKVAWAAGVGIKNSSYYEKYDIDYGVTYIPWSELPNLDFPQLLDGSFVDVESLPPNFDQGVLTTKKSRKKKIQQQNDIATTSSDIINPSLIPLPQAVPPLPSLPPPPLPPIGQLSVSSSSHEMNLTFLQQPIRAVPTSIPLPPSSYMLPSQLSSDTIPLNNFGNLSSAPQPKDLPPHFNSTIPPPFHTPSGMPPMLNSTRFCLPQTSMPTPDLMPRRNDIHNSSINPTDSHVNSNSSMNNVMENISNIPVLINSHVDSNNAQSDSRTFRNPNRSTMNFDMPVSSSLEISQLNSLPGSNLRLPISTPNVFHRPNQTVAMDKPQPNLQSQHHLANNYLLQRNALEAQLKVPGGLLGSLGSSLSSDQPFVKAFAQLVAQGMGDVIGQHSNNLAMRHLRSREMQQSIVLPSTMPTSQLRPNLLQPPPNTSLTSSGNQQETIKRLPMPSEFLRRLGASTTSAMPQGSSSATNKALLPIPLNAPSLMQTPTSLTGGLPQDGPWHAQSPEQQNSEPSTPRDSRPAPRKQPLLETPITPKDNSFTSHTLNMNHPAYNSLEHHKKESGVGLMPLIQTQNSVGDRFRTPRPPKLGQLEEHFDQLPENQHQQNVPMILNFPNSSELKSENLISETINNLAHVPSPQDCMGLLRSPLVNPATFLNGPQVLGPHRLDMGMPFRNPGMRGPTNFKMGDQRNLVRPQGSNHQRHRFPHNQQN